MSQHKPKTNKREIFIVEFESKSTVYYYELLDCLTCVSYIQHCHKLDILSSEASGHQSLFEPVKSCTLHMLYKCFSRDRSLDLKTTPN